MARTVEEQQARAVALMTQLHVVKGTLIGGTQAWQPPDPVEVYRDLYVRGAIDLETFEARLDVVFEQQEA